MAKETLEVQIDEKLLARLNTALKLTGQSMEEAMEVMIADYVATCATKNFGKPE